MYCLHCGHQFDSQAAFCSSCGVNITPQASPLQRRSPIVRPKQPRMVAGVCSGIAAHYGWDVALVRILLTVAVCLTSGAALLFYLAAWILIPEAPYALPPATSSVPTNMSPRYPV